MKKGLVIADAEYHLFHNRTTGDKWISDCVTLKV